MAEEGNNNTTTAAAAAGEPETQTSGILGTVKSYLGLDDKTVASVQDTAASTSASVTATAASVADAVLPESIKPDAVRGAAGTGADAGADNVDESKDETSAPADPTTDSSEDKTAATAAADDDDAAGADTKKSTGTSGGKPMENPDAIPTAGGQKLGEEHWGESKIVPDLPKTAEEESGVSSAAGQPTDEVKNNTSANTGGAIGGPPQTAPSTAAHTDPTASGLSSPARSGTTESDKKPKLMDRLKSKFKKDK